MFISLNIVSKHTVFISINTVFRGFSKDARLITTSCPDFKSEKLRTCFELTEHQDPSDTANKTLN